jgi:hypothetical protein
MMATKGASNMSEQTQCISLEDFIANAPAILQRLEAEGAQLVVEYGVKRFSVRPQKRRIRRPRRHFNADDPLFKIMGIGESTGPTDVSSNKHKYLADAAANLHTDSSAGSQE